MPLFSSQAGIESPDPFADAGRFQAPKPAYEYPKYDVQEAPAGPRQQPMDPNQEFQTEYHGMPSAQPTEAAYRANLGPNIPGQFVYDPTKPSNSASDIIVGKRGVSEIQKKSYTGGVPGAFVQIDHIVPVWLGGTNAPENLRAIPDVIHSHITKIQAVALQLSMADQAHRDWVANPVGKEPADVSKLIGREWSLSDARNMAIDAIHRPLSDSKGIPVLTDSIDAPTEEAKLKIAVAAYKRWNKAPSSAPTLQDTIGSLKGFFNPAIAAQRASENKPVVSAWSGIKSLVPTSVNEVKSIFNKENLSTAGHDLGHSPLAAAAREAADQATLGRIPVKPTENETGFAYDAAKLAGGTLGSFFPIILGGAALGKVYGAAQKVIVKNAPGLAKTLYGGRIATQAAVEAGDINAIRGAALKSEGFLQKYGPRFAKNSVLFGGLSQLQHYDEDTVANRAKAMASSLGISAVVSAVNPGLSKGLMGVFLGTGVISMLEGGSWKDALTSASTMTLFHGLGGDHAVPLGDKALWKAAVDKSAQHRSTVMGSDAYVPERAITDRSFKKKAGAINYRLDSETRTIDQKLWADSKGREEDIHASNMGDVQKEEALKEERSKLQADRAKNITAARALYLSSMPDKMRAIETAKDLKSLREHVDKAEAAKAEAAKKNTEGYSEKSTPPGADVPKREAEVSGPAQATEGPSVVFGEPEKAVDNFPDTPDQGPPMPKDWLSIAGNVQTDAQKAETAAYAKHTGDAFMDAVARTKATADQKSESAKDVSEALANRPEAPIVARPQPGSVVVKGPENLNPQPDSRFRKPPGSGWTLVRNAVEGKTEKRTKITGRKAAKIAAEASKDPLKFQKNVNEALNAGTIDKTTVRLLSDDQLLGAVRKVTKLYNAGHGKAPEARQRAMRRQAEMLFEDVVARDNKNRNSELSGRVAEALAESNASHPPTRPVHPEIEVGAREVVSQDPTIPYAEAVAIATKDRMALVAAGIAEPPAPVLADRGLPTKDNPTKINAQSQAISNARAQFGSAEHVTDVKERLAKLRLGKEEPVTAERRSEDFATEAQHESYVSANKDIEHSLKQVEANHNNDSVNENTDPIRNTTLRANLEKDLDANITELKAELHRRENRDGIAGKKSPQEAYRDSVLTDEHLVQLEAEGRARIESMVADEKGSSFQGTPKEKGIHGEASRQASAAHEPQTKSETESQKSLVASENMATYEHHASERTFDVSSMGSPSEQARMLKLLTSMHERGDITKRQADDVAEAYRTGDWSAVAEGPLRYDPVFSPVAADAQRWYDVATASKDNPSRDQGSYEATYDFAPTKKVIVKGLLGKSSVKEVPTHSTLSQDDKTRAAYLKAYIDGSKVFSFKGQQEEAIPDSILNRPEIVSRREEIHMAMQLTSNEHVLNENPFDEFNRPLGETGPRLGLSKEQYKDFEDGRYTDGKKTPNPFAFVLADAKQKSQAKGDPKSALMWDGTLRAANEEAAAMFARGESPYETLADIPVKDAHKALFPEGTGNEGVSRENLYDPRVANAMSLAPAIGNPAFRTNDPFINRIIDAYREKLISTKGGVRITVTAQPAAETDNTFNMTNHAFGFANAESLIGRELNAMASTPEQKSQVARYLRSDFDIQFLQDPKLEAFAHDYDDARADNDTPAQASRKAITAAKLEDEATQKLGKIYAEDASEHPLSEEHFEAKRIPKTPTDIVHDGFVHPDVEAMINEMIARGDSGKAQAADHFRQASKGLGRYFLDASLKDVETQRKALSAAEKDAARATEVIARVEKKLETERDLPKRKVLKYEIAHANLRLKVAEIARAEASGVDASKIKKDVRQAKMDLKKAPAPTAWKDVRDKVRQLQTGDVKQTAAEAGIRGLDEKIAQAKKDIASAKELGDLSENPEYHEAKDRLAELEYDKYLQEQGIVAPSPEDIAKKKAARDAAEAADPRQKMRRLSESARAATQAYNKVMAGERPAKP